MQSMTGQLEQANKIADACQGTGSTYHLRLQAETQQAFVAGQAASLTARE